jgi:hypothetical protein
MSSYAFGDSFAVRGFIFGENRQRMTFDLDGHSMQGTNLVTDQDQARINSD